jgi:hypothetical protein
MDSVSQMAQALLNKRYDDVMAERNRVMAPGGWREVAGNLLSTGASVMAPRSINPSALTLKPNTMLRSGDGVRRFNIEDWRGRPVGDTVIVQRNPSDLWVDWIGRQQNGPAGDAANSLGPSGVRSLIPQIKSQYPDAQRIGGFRGTGARSNITSSKTGWEDTSPMFGAETWMRLRPPTGDQ